LVETSVGLATPDASFLSMTIVAGWAAHPEMCDSVEM
jgi:hypothetical protein